MIEFLNFHFEKTDHVVHISKSLDMWYKMSPFLLLIQIIDPVQHDTEIRVFIDRARLFYDLGGKTFLTNKHIGDDKTFYMHVLRFYIPHISRVTLVKHNLGVGIYSMHRGMNGEIRRAKMF